MLYKSVAKFRKIDKSKIMLRVMNLTDFSLLRKVNYYGSKSKRIKSQKVTKGCRR